MKKIYISADVEGLNGITSFKQVLPEFPLDYAQMRPQVHLELNALINGLKKANIKTIVVNDAHNTMTNITLSELPEDVTLISGKPKKISMMYGLDETFDGAIFLGYHAKAGSDGVLAHTFNMHFTKVWLNNKTISEAELNAIYAKTKNVPIILASGDDVFCAEINSDIGSISTIQTKKAINKFAAICKTNKELLSEYTNAGKNIKNLPKINANLSDNYHLKVEFENSTIAQKIAEEINLKYNDNSIEFISTDYEEIYTTLQKISAQTTIVLQKSQNQLV